MSGILLFLGQRGGTEGATQVSLTDSQISIGGFATSHTAPGVSLGAEAPDRIIAFLADIPLGSNFVSATVNGNSANLIVTTSNRHLIYAGVPSGTTGDIVVTTSDSGSRLVIPAVYRIVAQELDAPYDFYTGSNNDSNASLTGTIDVPADGIIVAFSRTDDPAITMSWNSAVTENVDWDQGSSSYSAGSKTYATLQTGLSVTITPSALQDKQLFMASWG